MRKGMRFHRMLAGPARVGLALLLGLGAAMACSSATGPGDGDGQLTVLLTDAPFPYDLVSEANATIASVEVVGESGVEVLVDQEQSYNLLDLQNGVTATLGQADLPEGRLLQIRLIVTAASVVLTDGTTYELEVPSGAQTGIKITMPPGAEIAANQETSITLDFSVEDSFIVQGSAETIAGIEGFLFNPVITVLDVEVGSQAQAGGQGQSG